MGYLLVAITLALIALGYVWIQANSNKLSTQKVPISRNTGKSGPVVIKKKWRK